MEGIKKRRVSTVSVVLVKLLVLVAVMMLIYGKISNPHNFGEQFLATIEKLVSESKSIALLLVVILLMPINWFFEASKWQILSTPKVKLSLPQAYIGVLSGLSIGFVTPHGIGDYVGRIWQIDTAERGRLVGGIWLGKVTQMIMTLLFGILGLAVFFSGNQQQIIEFNSLSTIGLMTFLIILLAFLALLVIKRKTKILSFFGYYFGIISTYSLTQILKVSMFSFLRYLTFSVQFLLVMIASGIGMKWLYLFAGISWVFLIKSVIPSFNFLSDLGIREYSALTFFEGYEVDQTAIVASSLIIWVINILIPVLIGLVFMLKMKSSQK